MEAVKTAPGERIEAHIQAGVISGQVAVGKYVLQIGDVHGGVVNVAMPQERPRLRARSTPIDLRPRPFPLLLDRKAPLSAATAALAAAKPVEFYGRRGIGKTALLRYLANHPASAAYADGVVYLSARRQSLGELLQALFEAFYESDLPVKPSETRVRHALQNKKALILLDDVDLPREEIALLLDVAPRSTFLLASPDGHLWGEGRVLPLEGLPLEDATTLVARELGRRLVPVEAAAAKTLCAALGGHPLRIILAVARVRQEGVSLAQLAREVTKDDSDEALVAPVLAARSDKEKRALAAMAALGGAPLPADGIGALSGVADAVDVLDTLLELGLVLAEGSTYRLPDLVVRALGQIWDLSGWKERAFEYVLSWAERSDDDDDGMIAAYAEAVREMLRWAAAARRWADVLRLARAVDGSLALAARWEAWKRVLNWGLQAARELGNEQGIAWAHHQLGTRALCLGDKQVARQALIKALRAWQSLGDGRGVAITRHNLRILVGPPGPPRQPDKPPADPPPDPLLKPAPLTVAGVVKGVVLALVVTAAALAGLAITLPPSFPPEEPLPSPTPTLTELVEFVPTEPVEPTETATPTETLTPTETASPTPTLTPPPTLTPSPTIVPCYPRADWPVYMVQWGDTLSSIGRLTHSTAGALMEANCLPSTRINAGQALYVPVLPPTPVTPTFTPTPTDTPPTPPTLVTSEPCIPPDGWVVYIVQKGDTLYAIANSTHSTVAHLMNANCLDSEWIDAGQPLFVPMLPVTPEPIVTTPAPIVTTPAPIVTTPACDPLKAYLRSANTEQGFLLEWSSTGGCRPYNGNLKAQYSDQGTPYNVHEFLGAAGQLIDQPPTRCRGSYTINYTLALYDGSQQVATASASREVSFVC
jgi:LysM repeat protein